MLGVSSMGDLVGKGFSILSTVVGAIANFFMGVIIGFYLLASKEKRYAQIMKLRNAFFSEKANRRITEVCTMVNKSFGGYIRASLLDSVLVAVETYIIFQIFGISDYIYPACSLYRYYQHHPDPRPLYRCRSHRIYRPDYKPVQNLALYYSDHCHSTD